MVKVDYTEEEINQLINCLIDRLKVSQSEVWPPRFSVVVGIERGGVHISKKIAAALNLPHTTVKISHYGDGNQLKEATVDDWSFHVDLYRSCLIVDDLVDSGSTVATFRKHFGFREGVDAVAVLFYKPHSAYKPEFYVDKVNHWIVFPWEH